MTLSHRCLLMITTVAAMITADAHDIYTAPLTEIEKNNPQLVLYVKEFEASVAENATGLSPVNPEVELGYLWGADGIGNRKDVSVSQEFDFPTAYAKRSRLSRQKDNLASVLLKAKRREVLAGAKELLVELVYTNALISNLEEQCRNARQACELDLRLMEAGRVTRLDYNKALLAKAELDNDLHKTKVTQIDLLTRLQALNGGKMLEFTASEFPHVELPEDFDKWFDQAAASSPAMLYLKSQIEVTDRNVSVVKAEGLPKISLGYSGEFVKDGTFQGVTLGFSLPLWENRHKVRQARAEKAVAEMELDNARQDYYFTLKSLFNQAAACSDMAQRYEENLQLASSEPLLRTMLDKGEITVLDYLAELQYCMSVRQKLLEEHRDRALALTQLYAFSL